MRAPAVIGVIVLALILVLVAVGVALFNALGSGYLGQLFKPHTVMMLDLSVNLVERYKDAQGRYPETLERAKQYLKEAEVYPDMDFMGPLKMGERVRHFYYAPIEDGRRYYLFGIGLDDEPFTDDDVYPSKGATEQSDGFLEPEINA